MKLRNVRKDGPTLEAFLSFLAMDMVAAPQQIEPLDAALFERIDALVGRLPVNPDEDLGDGQLLR